MIYGSIISAIFVIAFAYIILSLANKESGNMKLAGQIIAALIVIIAVVILYFGATGRGHHGMMGGGMMGGGMTGEKCSCGNTEGMMKGKSSMMPGGMKCKCMMEKGTTKTGK